MHDSRGCIAPEGECVYITVKSQAKLCYNIYVTLCLGLPSKKSEAPLQFAVVYQNIPQMQGHIPQLPYTACLALMRLRSV